MIQYLFLKKVYNFNELEKANKEEPDVKTTPSPCPTWKNAPL
jgi:hypothetical protein